MSLPESAVLGISVSLSESLVLLFSLGGIIWGYVLALIAPEELAKGKKYFLSVKKIILGLILIFIDYYFYLNEKYYSLVIFAVLFISLFLMEIIYFSKRKSHNPAYGLVYYLLFIVSFILIPEMNFRLLLASMIFIYGLIHGTLLKRVEED